MAGTVVANVNLKPAWRARLSNERRKDADRWKKAEQARIEAIKADFRPASWFFLAK